MKSKLLLETAFFNIQTIREIKIENEKLGGKKRFPQFFTQYVCFLETAYFTSGRSTYEHIVVK